MSIPNIVQNASSIAIVDALLEIKATQFPLDRWLGTNNKYAVDTINRLHPEVSGNPPHNVKKKQIAHYIAASVPLHCQDGWCFLSKSVDSLIDGDIYSAVHMAYYAELRAIMSLFAAEGIGVFDNKHVWFDNARNYSVSPRKPTHKFVSEGFREWTNNANKSKRLLDIIFINSISLNDWLDAAVPGVGMNSLIAQDWLKTWSIDLQVLGNDQNIRNISSYRPQEIKTQPRPNVKKVTSTLMDLWNACKPTVLGKFGLLDMYLLRNALVKLYRNIPMAKTFTAFIDDTLSNLNHRMIPTNQLRNFLLKRTMKAEHPVLKEAKKNGLVDNYKIKPVSVISRALLLLRLATATTSELFQTTTTTKEDLMFWWETKGKETGLWSDVSTLTYMSDLWENIYPMIDDINTWLPTVPANVCILDSRTEMPFELWGLSKFQLAGFWGMWD